MEKELGLAADRKIIVVGGDLWKIDQFTTELNINFTVDKVNEDGVDLSGHSCHVYCLNTSQVSKKILMNYIIDDDTLKFTWNVGLDDIAKNGLLNFQVSFEGDNYIWKSYLKAISINNVIKILNRR